MSTTPEHIPLFRRVCSVEIDSMLIDQLRISFKVEKDMTKEPNRAHIKIYNLAEETRRRLQTGGASALRLSAGYKDQVETVFFGDITRVESFRENTEWVTEFSVGDGLKATRGKRAKKVAISKGGGISDAIGTLLDSLGTGRGNLKDALAKTNLAGDVKKWALSGNTADLVDELSAHAGLSFSMQDGHPSFARLSSLVDATIVNLSPDTGLIGSPELTKKGYVKAKALIQQKLTPGRGVLLAGQSVQGLYQIHKVTYEGDTHADPWFADLELLQVTKV